MRTRKGPIIHLEYLFGKYMHASNLTGRQSNIQEEY